MDLKSILWVWLRWGSDCRLEVKDQPKRCFPSQVSVSCELNEVEWWAKSGQELSLSILGLARARERACCYTTVELNLDGGILAVFHFILRQALVHFYQILVGKEEPHQTTGTNLGRYGFMHLNSFHFTVNNSCSGAGPFPSCFQRWPEADSEGVT